MVCPAKSKVTEIIQGLPKTQNKNFIELVRFVCKKGLAEVRDEHRHHTNRRDSGMGFCGNQRPGYNTRSDRWSRPHRVLRIRFVSIYLRVLLAHLVSFLFQEP